jgi:uncharacterized protein with von Willebrand factor type A (vWA) domain
MTAMYHPAFAVVALGRRLRDAGLPIGVDQVEAFAAALPLVDVLARSDVYFAARATLVTRHEDLAVFDDEFVRWLGGAPPPRAQKMPRAPRHDLGLVKTALGSYMAQRAAAADREVELPETAKAASALEQLQRKDFALCTDAEREAIARAMQRLRLELTRRESLRRVPARRGRWFDLAAAVRAAARHGGAIGALPRRTRKRKQRPLVVLADISGSMELYTRLVLQFLHALARQHDTTEVFVFGTRLTRITPQLALRDLDAALDRAALEIIDYAGGTRIGECLAAFERGHARRVVRRGAVVLIISDGLDTGPADVLAREVRRLQSRSHRLVWLSPLLGTPGYRPVTEGMAAALPFIDDFLPVRDLGSLESLARHLATIPRRRGGHISGVHIR